MKRKLSLRFLSLCLATVLLALPMTALASDLPRAEPDRMTTDVAELLQPHLEIIAEHPTAYRLEEFDAGVLEVGAPFYAYLYLKDGGLTRTADVYYPIFYRGQVAMLLTVLEDGVGQISTWFRRELDQCYQEGTRIAFIYDAEHCYLYTGDDIRILSTYSPVSSERAVFADAQEALTAAQSAGVVATQSEVQGEVAYQKPDETEAPGTNAPVVLNNYPFVTQNSIPTFRTNTCWAAVTASIGNFLHPTLRYTTPYIARFVYGPAWNTTATIETAMSALKNIYDIVYSNIWDYQAPPEGIIYYNLQQGYPLYTTWQVGDSASSHACAVYGFAPASGLLNVMDPENQNSEMTTAARTADWKYTFRSSFDNETLTLDGYASMYFQSI